ncbi:MAG TPA: efflux transporter outer membrane subunit [Puia sp.]|nr:efflux transporter outer membrane subunit [Puia sp.]
MKKLFPYGHIFIIILLTVFASCRMGKNYQRPTVPLPESFNQTTTSSDTNSIADITWRNFFTDPVLQELIDSGISRNYDLSYALRNISIAQSQVKQASWLWYPQLNAAVGAQYNRYSDNGPLGVKNGALSNNSSDYLASVSMNWEIDIWGKISRQKEASMANYLQTYEAAKAIQTRLVADIAQGYFSLLMLDQQLLETKKTLALTTDFVKLTRLLFNAGEVTYLAIQQSESQMQSTAQLIPLIEQNIQIQENSLEFLTGNLPGAIRRDVSLTDIHFNDSLSTGIPIAILNRRPDVRANEMSLVKANAQVGVSQANIYPALTLTAGTGFESLKASNWFNIPGSLFGLAGGTLVQPVLQGRQLKTQFEIAKQQREQAVILFRQSVLNAAIEVSNALIQVSKLREQEIIAKQRTDTLSAAVGNAQLLFKNDLANYLEVITAQQTALDAQLSLAFIQRAELDARVELYRSLGGGWK